MLYSRVHSVTAWTQGSNFPVITDEGIAVWFKRRGSTTEKRYSHIEVFVCFVFGKPVVWYVRKKKYRK